MSDETKNRCGWCGAYLPDDATTCKDVTGYDCDCALAYLYQISYNPTNHLDYIDESKEA